ncbi:unnamed protein product [Leptidea sinapis]|uniref:Enolase-phosphatase E1 n=1 Tax=Leptidea sinapis TaxID=189913 RepID=A0A5E4QV33_9NEOP|nr:unnamed protein product [Leptidea sinapis]
MANTLKDIGEIVKKCKILLLDIEGTTTSISFVKDKLFPYAEENVKQFLDSQWDNDDVKEVISALRKLALEDKENGVEGVVAIPGEDTTKEEQIEGVVNNVKWQMSLDRKVGALKQLQGLVWQQGYDKGDIKGHVYDDVLPALEQWKAVDGQKVYIYSSGSVQAQKLLFGHSLAGDLLKFIEGHFDTAVGPKQGMESYKAIVGQIGCSAEDVLFLTDIEKEAEAARSAGLQVALVSRDGNAELTEEATGTYPVIKSFTQLATNNKRKTDPENEPPVKLPKTCINDDFKTLGEADSAEVPEKEEPCEKMEVDDTQTNETPAVNNDKPDKQVETVVVKETEKASCADKDKAGEVNSKSEIEVIKAPEIETVENKDTNVDEKKIEAMEPVIEEPEILEPVPVESLVEKNDTETVTNKTSPPTITEIDDITNENLADVIENTEPVVEEPPEISDMEVLQNVGEELEKCDEILTKVQNVINSENISLKPVLNTITEEPMEVENDTVDKITETESTLKSTLESTEVKSDSVENKEVVVGSKDGENVEHESCKSRDSTEVNGDAKKTETSSSKVDNKIEVVETKHTEEDKPVENPITEESSQKVDAVKKSVENDTPVKDSEQKTETAKSIAENDTTTKDTTQKVEPVKNSTENDTTIKETEVAIDTKESSESKDENVTESVSEPKEVLTNGDKNGEKELKENGISNDDVSSRLSVENGKEVNGANGATNGDQKEEVKEDCKVLTEVSEIKVKSLPAEEPCTDPVEQPSVA